jgi:ureidoacrylate peracid hydrolase
LEKSKGKVEMLLDAIDPNGAALLIIDMQNGFLQEKPAIGSFGASGKRNAVIVPPIKRLIERFRQAGIPVIWMVQEDIVSDASIARKRLDSQAANRRQITCAAGTRDAEIIDELKPLADVNPTYVVRKHRLGAFYETRLELLLRQLGARSLFIAGTTADTCVETTIREAHLRDFDVVAVTDCIAGLDDPRERVTKNLWAEHFCALCDSSDVLSWIDAQSGPRILGFAHMVLQVGDLEASAHFYRDLLGFTARPAIPLADGRPVVPFRQGIVLTSGTPAKPLQIDHMAFRVNDVRAIARRLKAEHVKLFDDLHNGVYGLTIYAADPDGNKVELFQEGASLQSDG